MTPDSIPNYAEFVADKARTHTQAGIADMARDYGLFDHQTALSRWALRRGRAAIFADTGLGKSRMQIAWADTVCQHTGGDVLILAPLAVAEQTVEEGQRIGVAVCHARDAAQVQPGITITNYDRLHKFDASRFAGVVLDESSIIKHHTAKTLAALLAAFADTPYRLCATATPAPNDWTELGNHAEFLGVRSRVEMLAEFFAHDGGETQTWRLKGHARQAFWRWVATWGAVVRSPADLGYDASRYALPPLSVTEHALDAGQIEFDLFPREAITLAERRHARRASLAERVAAAASLINASADPWIVWCDLNAEGDALEAAIPDAIQIAGADPVEIKESRLSDFAHGRARVLITKPKIAGFGLNWQHCAHVAFVGVTDSFESYYQAVRRCWRFGQTRPVKVHLFVGAAEGAVLRNLQRKEADAIVMAEAMAAETADSVRESVLGSARESNPYQPTARIALPAFLEAA